MSKQRFMPWVLVAVAILFETDPASCTTTSQAPTTTTAAPTTVTTTNAPTTTGGATTATWTTARSTTPGPPTSTPGPVIPATTRGIPVSGAVSGMPATGINSGKPLSGAVSQRPVSGNPTGAMPSGAAGNSMPVSGFRTAQYVSGAAPSGQPQVSGAVDRSTMQGAPGSAPTVRSSSASTPTSTTRPPGPPGAVTPTTTSRRPTTPTTPGPTTTTPVSPSKVPTPTRRPCSPVWSTYTGSRSLRAVRYRQYTNKADCQAACASGAIPSCVAVDLDDRNPDFVACLAHVLPAEIAVRFSTSNVNQYQLTSATGCSGTYTSGGSSCGQQWISSPGVQSIGSVKYNEYTTNASCLTGCLNTVPNCVGADTVISPFECWLYNDPGNMFDLYNGGSGVVQYRSVGGCLNKGICAPVWDNGASNIGSVGGRQQSFNNVNDCKANCVATSGCVAIDFGPTSSANPCWFHTDARDLYNQTGQSGVTQYLLLSICP